MDRIANWRYVIGLGVSVLGADPSRCPTYGELAALSGVAVAGTYAPNRLTAEKDISAAAAPRSFSVYTAVAGEAYAFGASPLAPDPPGPLWTPGPSGEMKLIEGAALSDNSAFAFNADLYVRNTVTGKSAVVPASATAPGGSYTVNV